MTAPASNWRSTQARAALTRLRASAVTATGAPPTAIASICSSERCLPSRTTSLIRLFPRIYSKDAAAFERLRPRDLVGVIEVTADRQAIREPRHRYAARPDQSREVERRRFTFGVGIGCDDHFLRLLARDAFDQLFDAQLRRTDPVHRRDETAQDVIASPIRGSPLEGKDVLRFGDDAQERRVAPLVGADRARVVFGKREAARAEPHAVFHRQDRFGERLGFGARPVEQKEDQTRRRLWSDRRQLRELVDQALDGAGDRVRD